jgi:hypothetical protein
VHQHTYTVNPEHFLWGFVRTPPQPTSSAPLKITPRRCRRRLPFYLSIPDSFLLYILYSGIISILDRMLLNVKQEGNHVASTSLEKITRSVHGSAAHGAQLLRRRDAGSPKQQEARCCSSSRPRTHCPGVRVQRHAHRPLLPLARRALRSEVIIDRGGRSGGRRREAEERPGMLINKCRYLENSGCARSRPRTSSPPASLGCHSS